MRPLPRVIADGVVAGLTGALVGGIPSTAHALLTGGDVREATLAAGTLVLPSEARTRRLAIAGLATHLAVSVGWGVVLAATLPRRHTASSGAVAGLAIAALDLGVVGRRAPRIAALPLAPQLADHAAYGTAVGFVLSRRVR